MKLFVDNRPTPSADMYRQFPRMPFCFNDEHLELLDCVLVKNKDAIIYYKHNDYPHRAVELIYIKRDDCITYHDFYQECCDKWSYDCGGECYLKYIEVKNDTQIELWFDSNRN